MLLKKENDKLRLEQAAMRNALRNPMCTNCGGQVIIPEIPYEEQSLKAENERLKEELTRICLLSEKFIGKPISSISSSIAQMPNSSSEFSFGNICCEGLNHLGLGMPMGLDTSLFGSISLPDVPIDSSLMLQLAVNAMDELVKMTTTNHPLWNKSSESVNEVLNYDEYVIMFPPSIGSKPNGFIVDASRDTAVIFINTLSLVETFVDVVRYLTVQNFLC